MALQVTSVADARACGGGREWEGARSCGQQ